jgi:hypothetical protein
MTITPFPRFRAFPTHHCVTGSMRHMYAMLGRDVSEELLLGLGAGVGFVYWHQKGAPPFLGGRANVGRPGEEGLEVVAGRRTGVAVTSTSTTGARRAEAALVAGLSAGRPAMLQVDMGLLPYFDFPGEYHFGGHVVAVVGYDADAGTTLVCDRDVRLHEVSLASLAAARGSSFKPFPPRHRSWDFDVAGQRPPTADEVEAAIEEAATGMLRPPIANLGIRGIRKAAHVIPRWPDTLDTGTVRDACRDAFVMIDATGGTGGGLFRYMYARFLEEAAALVGDAALRDISRRLAEAGDRWQDAAAAFDLAARDGHPATHLAAASAALTAAADVEEDAWQALLLRRTGHGILSGSAPTPT